MSIVFTDLDGTLLNSNALLSTKNLTALKFLQSNKIYSVIATGRNIFSCKKVLSDDIPIDYLIFSSGIGLMNFKTKKIIKSYYFKYQKSIEITKFLLENRYNFFAHRAIPHTHLFYYNRISTIVDFDNRLAMYKDFGQKFNNNLLNYNISQFVVVLDKQEKNFFELKNKLKSIFSNIKIIRATSPLNHQNIWLEIYPKNISKGNSVVDLCNYLNEDISKSIAIGNDYNDIDMLEVVNKGFVVSNSPQSMKNNYKILGSNNSDAFYQLIKQEFM